MKLRLSLLLSLLVGIGNSFAKDQDTATTQPSYHPFISAQAKEQYLAFNDTLSKKWPVKGETKMVTTSFGETFIRISGPADAAPLVLLPGGGTSSLMWRTNVEAFSEHFRVYALDNIYDYGRSVYLRPIKNADDFSNWLNELFSELNLGDSINLVGTSYGGWITSQFVLRYPGRLKKIALLAPAATVQPLKVNFIIRAILSNVNHNFFKRFFYWVFADLTQKDENGRQRVESIIEETDLSIRCFKATKVVIPTVLKDEELHNLQVSTLYLVGEHEKLYSAKKAVQRLNKVAPQIKTQIIPGAGHDLTAVQADLVDSLVLHFLEE